MTIIATLTKPDDALTVACQIASHIRSTGNKVVVMWGEQSVMEKEREGLPYRLSEREYVLKFIEEGLDIYTSEAGSKIVFLDCIEGMIEELRKEHEAKNETNPS